MAIDGSDGARDLNFDPFRFLVAIAVLCICMVLLRERLAGIELDHVATAIGRIEPWQWAVALGYTACSFVAVGFYDTYIHRWLGTGVPSWRAGLSGAASIAVAQTVGLGLVTATIARWRLLPRLPVLKVAAVTATVSVSFMVALLVVIGAVLWVSPPLAGPSPAWLLPAGLTVGIGAILLSLTQPRWCPVRLPPLRLMAGVLLATAIDTIFCAVAFFMLLEPDLTLSLTVFLAPFLVALGAGLLSGAPAGAGPFELTLFLLLPMVPEPELLASIFAFRLVYYVLPALLGAALLLLRPGSTSGWHGGAPRGQTPPALQHPEIGLTKLGEFSVIGGDGVAALAADTGQALVILGDPVFGHPPFATLSRRADHRGLVPAIYKGSARLAALARKEGWIVQEIAKEVLLDPVAFSTQVPACRQLRRKLRKAVKAGVTVEQLTERLPMAALSEIAEAWSARRGGERGFSMGRWHPDYVADQRVYGARQGGRLTAFATFHDLGDTWVLDLMRSGEEAADGTMHAIIATALEDAASAGCRSVSLAAIPSGPAVGPFRAVLRTLVPTDGLRQFKLSFAPRLAPRYLMAPTRAGLAIAALDIARRVHRPVPLPVIRGPGPRLLREHAWDSVSS